MFSEPKLTALFSDHPVTYDEYDESKNDLKAFTFRLFNDAVSGTVLHRLVCDE
jgi:hypothetical protein